MSNISAVSVIIPTCNRAEVLRRTLKHYAIQTGYHQLKEIIVLDDGSTDHTRQVVEECQKLFSIELHYSYQKNAGLGAARNRAMQKATGDLLLFGDDDIVPARDMVAQHVSWHYLHPEPEVGVLGQVVWAAELDPTPFMEWSGRYGPQFNFGYFKAGMQLGFEHAYFCNTSIKAEFIRRYTPFDERLRTYGYEDIELGFRLCREGYRLLYNPDAAGHHYKYETFDDTVRRVNRLYGSWPAFAATDAGKAFHQMVLCRSRKEPSLLGAVSKPLKVYVAPLLKPLCDSHIPLPHWFYRSVFYHFVEPFSQIAVRWDESRSTAVG